MSVSSCRLFSLFDYFSLLLSFFFFSFGVHVLGVLGGKFILPESIIFMGYVISRATIGLSFLKARNKTFPVTRKLVGLQCWGTKWLQRPSQVRRFLPPLRVVAQDIPLVLRDAVATLVSPCPATRLQEGMGEAATFRQGIP